MTTCPYCGSSYITFQTNCKNCGAPLPPVVKDGIQTKTRDVDFTPPKPPAPPRTIAETYVFRLMWADGIGVSSIAFLIIGILLIITGVVKSLLDSQNFDASLISGFGWFITVSSAAIGFWSYWEARQKVQVLRIGQAALGRILTVEQRAESQSTTTHTWVIHYNCIANGKRIRGKLLTRIPPGKRLQAGNQVWVLYLPDKPKKNTIYPHP